jgi:hypothetical protein
MESLDEITDDLRKKSVIAGYTIGYSWTKQGSSEGLEDKVIDGIREILRGRPQFGLLYFRRLADGGYEIRTIEK